MTTEDNGFFKHRGWVTSEFKSALQRNLQRGGFRVGASSITMQMVKNVLLSQEKTLSRKLQELFLVWYLEQELPKERILELYFNAIEFGPRIYGIGAAARHYFGKTARRPRPRWKAAFFSSILPSPKRRYIQYCHGSLTRRGTSTCSASWPRCTSAAASPTRSTPQAAAAERWCSIASEANFNEKQCLDWVKKITARPEPEAPPELDDGDGDVAAENDIARADAEAPPPSRRREGRAGRGGQRGRRRRRAARARDRAALTDPSP